ncbi:hypothetical protein [Streptomyces seoulensis]|uniref:hypothetical protein n=1 Tax=Streptomyces seoulensis TaxID=73044 RepID=UPI0033BF8985
MLLPSAVVAVSVDVTAVGGDVICGLAMPVYCSVLSLTIGIEEAHGSDQVGCRELLSLLVGFG